MLENSGVKKFFEQNWEQLVLWAILIGLFYLLRPFFLLIFETFLITYITKGVVEWILKKTHLNYCFITVAVFLVFVGLLVTAGAWIGPKLVIETNQILRDFAGEGEQQTKEKINRVVENTVKKIVGQERGQSFIGSQQYTDIVETLKAESSKGIKTALPRVLEWFLHFIKILWEILISLVLSIIFSFIIVLDWQKIAGKMRELETSRIRTFYLDAAPHLMAFANVLGKAFRAQAIIATCNTLLTAAGLWFFEVPNIAILSIIVFSCGFIPILGLFLSAIPILLFGIQAGGLTLILKLIAFISLVHMFEAYVLNPKITADVLHVHPILILILLLIGERFFGIWGMIVGVPIGYYIISVVTKKDENLIREISEIKIE